MKIRDAAFSYLVEAKEERRKGQQRDLLQFVENLLYLDGRREQIAERDLKRAWKEHRKNGSEQGFEFLKESIK